MLIFQTESVNTVQDTILSLAQEHWVEVEESMYGEQEYSLDINTYNMLESLNMLHISTARNIQEKLCGYAVFVLSACHHQKKILKANLDAFYMSPAIRKGFNAILFLRSAENALKKRGIIQVQYSSPASRPCDALYKRLGARHTENIYYKEL